jgi:hypothetical protein
VLGPSSGYAELLKGLRREAGREFEFTATTRKNKFLSRS